MFLWRNLQPDAVAVLLRYLARRSEAAKSGVKATRPPAAAGPRSVPPADHRR